MTLTRGVATFFLCGAAVLLAAACGSEAPLPSSPDPYRSTPSTDSVRSTLLPAFPGAEGWGATALNESRELPLRVIQVTSRDAQGPGTLLDALERTSHSTYDVIVFRTGGRFMAPPGGFRLQSSHVYIAGQTAPGGGVVIEGRGTSFWLRGTGVSDIVLRHLRFRGRGGATDNNLIIATGERIVLDHLSLSWTNNYLLAILRYDSEWSSPISNVSVQNSLLSEAFAVHPTAFQIASGSSLRTASLLGLTNVSVHRNLFAHNSHRNPSANNDNSLVANNVIYNWNQGVGRNTTRGVHDWVNNYGRAGPMTDPRYLYMVNPSCDDDIWVSPPSLYVVGNLGPLSADPDGDNWREPTRQVACYHTTGLDGGGERVPHEWKRDPHEPQNWRTIPFPPQLRSGEDEILEIVLSNAGANRRVGCDGHWIDARDAVDLRVVRDVTNGTGPSSPIPNETSVGGWPAYAAGVACVDSDGDGLPDAWEERFFGCATCATPDERGRDGYLVIEHYLNGTRVH